VVDWIWDGNRHLRDRANSQRRRYQSRSQQRRHLYDPEFSDDILALKFSSQHAHDLRYVAKSSFWFLWDGARWKREDTLRTYDLARLVAREFATGVRTKSSRRSITSAKTIAAIEKLARADRQHATTVDQWDADTFVFNVPPEENFEK
jgi:putative DNA primase/helicase